jgi:DNA polymerase III subunit epsilon
MIIGLDTETTDLEFGDNGRLVEVCAALYKPTGDLVEMKTWRINPECSMSPKAQAVHGIALSDLIIEPTFLEVAEDIEKFLLQASGLVIHNANFDCKFVGNQWKKLVGPSELLRKQFDITCTMLGGRWATPMGAVPSLKALAFACGVDYDEEKAHAADYDVSVMMECFFYASSRGVNFGYQSSTLLGFDEKLMLKL